MPSRTTKIGSSTVTSVDHTDAIIKRVLAAAPLAAASMAAEAKAQAEELFATDGDGHWNSNAPETIEWKGHDKVMLGRTAELSSSIEIRDHPADPSPKTQAVGWFDAPHPDTDGLTMADLAAIHETDRPWLSQIHDNPQRAAAVLEAGKAAYAKVA